MPADYQTLSRLLSLSAENRAITNIGAATTDFDASGNLLFGDNTGITLGTGSDVTLRYDGTDTVFNLRAVGTGNLRVNAMLEWATGVAADAAEYSIGRNADGTNLLQANVPTGASYEFSINDVAELTVDALTINILGNRIDFESTGVTSIRGVTTSITTEINSTDRLIYSAGLFAFQEATTIRATTGGLTLDATANTVLLRDRVAWSTDTGVFPGILLTNDVGVAGLGNFGSSIGLSKPGENGGRRHAAIAVRQGTADVDQVGISFFVHDDISAAVAMIEAIRIEYDGSLDMLNRVISNIGAAGTDFTSTGGLNIAANIVAGAGAFYRSAVVATITASTTQTQGNGPLTSEVNEVSTVANANDTVTLPTAAAGMRCVVINNGVNTLRIFPASGDNLGAGVDTATTLASGSNVVYQAYDATNWESI